MGHNPLSGIASDRTFARRVCIVVVIGTVAAAVWALSDILLLLFGSILVAVMLRATGRWVATLIGIADGWGVLATGILILAGVAACGLLLGPGIAREMQGLFERLPAAVEQLNQDLGLGSFADLLKGSSPASSLGNLVMRMFAWGTTILGALASFVLVIFGGIYLAAHPQLYRDGFVKLVPPAVHPNVNATLDDAGAALQSWLRGQLIAMLLVGFLTGLGLWLVGVPSAAALGLIAGLAEFVPIIGPIVAAVPALLLASSLDWQTVVWVAGIFVVVQQIESNLITPLIADRTVFVPPALGLFAVVAMGVLLGPLGLLFGFPLAIVLDVAIRRLYVRDTLGEAVEIMGKQPTDAPGEEQARREQ